MKDAATLAALAGAIYGPDWVAPLARDVSVNLRTAQRWAAGTVPVPAWLWGDGAFIAAAIAAGRDLAGRLERISEYLRELRAPL
jgi:phenolic acid decarboxylase|tara:strand:+ start:307 stop:558 length:252 start_codon:yes stop_codon:yes gene_type:complete